MNRFLGQPYAIQKLVGIGSGTTSVIVGFLNLVAHWQYDGETLLQASQSFYVWVPLVFGVLFALSSLWRSPVAGWIQVFVLLAASILSSLTSHIGELTSSLFLIFGIVLVFELRLPRIPSGVVTAISLIAYPLALSVGYAKFGPA